VFEIDEQHSGLDQLLEFILTSGPTESQSLLPMFLTRLKAHFKFEEGYSIDDRPFVSKAHAAAHREMEVLVEDLIQNALGNGGAELRPIITEMGVKLMSHVANYDAPMNASSL
jgi:hemerythrin